MALSVRLLIGIVADASFSTCYGNDPCNACQSAGFVPTVQSEAVPVECERIFSERKQTEDADPRHRSAHPAGDRPRKLWSLACVASWVSGSTSSRFKPAARHGLIPVDRATLRYEHHRDPQDALRVRLREPDGRR